MPPPSGPPPLPAYGTLGDAYQHCARVVSARAKNFRYAFLLLPRHRRRGLEAIYAYCRVADDMADEDALPEAERARRLADLRLRLRCALPQPHDPDPPRLAPSPGLDLMLAALGDTARRFGVQREDLDLVAQGCEQDLTVRRYATFQDLHDYCYKVASAVGLACLEVFGYRGSRDEARALAVDLGIAMQLTNIIRDVNEDILRDRIYLPQEDLAHFGISEDQIKVGKVDAAWKSMLAFQVERARSFFSRGARLARRVRRSSRVCPLALASIYQALLTEVERADYDVFERRVTVSKPRKVALMGVSAGRGILGI